MTSAVPPAFDVTASGKRGCPDCGGDLEWNASRQLLMCPYCGFIPKEQPTRGQAGGAIREHDLEEALARVDDSGRGYGTPTVKVKCQSCHAISVFEPHRVAERCHFCGSPAIVPYESTHDAITPESLLPVRLSESHVRDLLRQWYASHWLAPTKLKRKALTDTLHGVYLPYWTFDSDVTADWTAESGDYYYVTEWGMDAQGRRVQRQVRKVRWYPSRGRVRHFFDDDLVCGSRGVREDLIRAIEPFPTDELTPYDPAFVRGWTVERYQVDLRQASVISKEQMDSQAYQMCARQVPGDTYRNLQMNSIHRNRTFKHILVPTWLVTYVFHGTPFQVVVNGYTGEIAGDSPKSWVKVFFFVILPILLAAALIVWLMGQQGSF
jgi:hypothetical protein